MQILLSAPLTLSADNLIIQLKSLSHKPTLPLKEPRVLVIPFPAAKTLQLPYNYPCNVLLHIQYIDLQHTKNLRTT